MSQQEPTGGSKKIVQSVVLIAVLAAALLLAIVSVAILMLKTQYKGQAAALDLSERAIDFNAKTKGSSEARVEGSAVVMNKRRILKREPARPAALFKEMPTQ